MSGTVCHADYNQNEKLFVMLDNQTVLEYLPSLTKPNYKRTELFATLTKPNWEQNYLPRWLQAVIEQFAMYNWKIVQLIATKVMICLFQLISAKNKLNLMSYLSYWLWPKYGAISYADKIKVMNFIRL